MANNPANPVDEQKASRGDNAKRLGKVGLLVGAIAGLLSGGGIPAIIQFSLLAGGVSAAGGAVAGDKITPMLDKVTGFLPWNKNKAPETPKVDIPEIDENRKPVFQLVDEPEQEKAAAPEQQANYRPVSAIDSSVLENARAATGASVRSAGEGMAADAKAMEPGRIPDEWVSREAHGKRATHEGPAVRQ